MSGTAWVTLATNDSYSLGALVLAHSLRQVGTVHQLAVLVTPGVSGVMREKLASVFNVVKEVNILDSRDAANLRLLQRPELGITFTKLHCWRLTQYSKCVFLDADTLVLQNADELFEREEFSAAPDVGWPDCFNSGVFVYCPSEDTYGKIVQFALEKGSFDGGDQGLLNLYFSDWAHKDISKHLPFIYNMCSTASYSYLPAFKQFGDNIKIIHFISNTKPWLQYFDTETREVHVSSNLQHLRGIVQHWWNIFCSLVHPSLSPEMARSRAAHYTSFDSNTRSVPPEHNPPFHYDSFSENVFIENTDSQTMQSDHTNVWDPWEDYEKKQDETPILQSSDTQHIECSQKECLQILENVPHTESFAHNPELTESFAHNPELTESYQPHDTSIHAFSSSVQFLSESHSCVDDNIAKVHTPNIEVPQSFSTDDNKTQVFEYSTGSPPTQEIPNLKTSLDSQTTVVHIPSEHNQLARPHECEPASCVTTENALHVKPSEVHDGNAGLAGAFAQLTLGVPRTAEQSLLEDHLRRQGWEVGNIDYMGRDSFDNIWSKICETLADPAPSSEPVQSAPVAAPQVPSPAAAPVEPQPVPEPVKAPEIDSAPKEPPAKAAEVPIATAEPKPESVPQAEVKPTALPSEAPKPEESCPKPIPPAEPAPAVSCPIPTPAAVASESKPPPPETAKPAPPPPSDTSKTVSGPPSEPPKESAASPKPSTPSDIPEPAAVPESPKPETVVPSPTQTPQVPPQQPEAKAPEPEKPAQAAVAPPVSQQAPPASPLPKPEAEPTPAPPKPQQTPPPSSPSPKTEAAAAPAPPSPKVETAAAPAPVIPQQTPPPSPKAETAAAPASPKSQQTPPSSPSTKAEPAPPKSQQTPPSSPSPKAGAAPVLTPAKPQQTPPPSPQTESAPPKSPQIPKTETAAAPKSQKTPPSSPSPKAEAAAAAPPKSQQTPPSSPSPKAQPKAAPTKEAAAAPSEVPSSPTPSSQPKAAPAKKAAPAESAAASEEAGAATGGQGPTPPPRKTGGGGTPKKSGKGKK